MIAQSVAEIINRQVKLTVEGDRPDVPQHLCAGATVRTGDRPVLPRASWSAAAVGRPNEPADADVRGKAGGLCGPAWDCAGTISSGAAQGRGDGRASAAVWA